ncbi:MAG: DinB family protein [Bacteroidales bacterium]|nr:DinB family protein [Bacteroidales bacterium]
MIKEFEPVIHGILSLLDEWEPRLLALTNEVITNRRNSQNRTIKQILGHLVDSASNNTHRMVHLQYRESPLHFPNYASHGNNDRWIAIQNYQQEDWHDLVMLWKYANRHIAHVMQNVDPSKLSNQWYCSDEKLMSLKDGIIGYLSHFELHLHEIDELIKS